MSEHEVFGVFYGWWRGDPLPPPQPAGDLRIERIASPASPPADLPFDRDEAQSLLANGHHLYTGKFGDQLAGHGWIASRTASIGELGVTLRLTDGEGYLWGFETQPAWRGRGVYSALLQAILHQESDITRFWVGHNAGNEPSARGILTAGFTPVGEAYPDPNGTLRYRATRNDERGQAAQTLLGLPGDTDSDANIVPGR